MDIIKQIIEAGIKAPSSHNMQPWKFKILNLSSFDFYADLSKELKVSDKDHRQMIISCGTVVGEMRQKAKELNMHIDVLYYLDFIFDEPLYKIATIKIVRTRDYSHPYDSLDALDKVCKTVCQGEYGKHFFVQHNLPEFKKLLLRATEVRSKNKEAVDELLSVFRLSEKERAENHYGLYLRMSKPWHRFMIEKVFRWMITPQFFARQEVKFFKRRLKNEVFYLVITMEEPALTNYLYLGEAMIELYSIFKDYYMKPTTNIIEDFDDIKPIYHELQDYLKTKNEIMFVIGFSHVKPMYHEYLRHQYEELIIE